MTLPTSDGLHYVGCHCNDPCTCDDIECVHEQCICDRLSTAYQQGRKDERFWVRERLTAHTAEHWACVCDNLINSMTPCTD